MLLLFEAQFDVNYSQRGDFECAKVHKKYAKVSKTIEKNLKSAEYENNLCDNENATEQNDCPKCGNLSNDYHQKQSSCKWSCKHVDSIVYSVENYNP